jgi:2-methylcitrate dehydratase
MHKPPLIAQLADWIVAFDAKKIPPEVTAHTKHLLLDTIGCALAAHEEEAFESALATVREIGGVPHCSVIGCTERTSLPNAVFLNGTLIRSLDANDIYIGPRLPGHPSDNIAVALSAAEREGRSGEELLAAIVIGYEIYGRFADLGNPGSLWDNVTLSGFVAPAIAGRLMQLSAAHLTHALAVGVAMNNTLSAVRSGQLSGAKNLADALVGCHAVFTTLLAKHGLTGPAEIIESPRGFAKAVFGGADLTPIVGPAAEPYRIMDVAIKAYPCIGTAQAIVAAAVKAREWVQDPAAIAAVTLRLVDTPFINRQREDQERRYPRTRETADHSFYYLTAAGLMDGEVTVQGFKRQRWLDADMKALMERITITPDASLNAHTGTFPCVLEVTLKSGARHEVAMIHAPGSVQNRMTQQQVEAKFCSNAARLSAAKQDEIIAWVRKTENRNSVAELMQLLRA